MEQVSVEAFKLCEGLISEHEKLLSCQRTSKQSQPEFDLMSNSLAWSDELPPDLSFEFRRVYTKLLHLRTLNIFGKLDPTGDRLLKRVRELVPEWAFCDLNRFSPIHKELYDKLRENVEQELTEAATRFNRSGPSSKTQ